MTSLRILVVEDEETDRIEIRRAFRQSGLDAELEEHSDGASGLNALMTNEYDCALIDYRLPQGDGLTLIEKARAAGVTTPLVVITALGNEEVAVQMFQAGATDYIPKTSFSADRLAQTVRNAVRMRAVERAEERAVVSLQEREARLHSIYQSTPDGLISLAANGAIEASNPAAEHLFEMNSAALATRTIKDILSLTGDDLVQIHRELETTSVATRQTEAKRDHESTVPVEASFALLPLPAGSGLTISIRDISERLVVDRLKDEFTAMISHELRTPLTSILGTLSLLKAGDTSQLPDKMARLVELAHRNGERLGRLVNDILDFQALETGKIRMSLQPVRIETVVHEALEANQDFARENGSVELELVEELKATVRADTDRLFQVLTNLLSNAIKYSPENGSVQVRISRHGDSIRTAISDRGPGIKPEDLDQLFDRFVRLATKPRIDTHGSGLGLSIAQKIIKEHDGRIWVESEIGKGSIFLFELPEFAGDSSEVNSV